MHGHPGAFAHNVPKCAVDRAHGVIGVDACSPVRSDPGCLPDLFDLIDVAANRLATRA
jgi:hypothetical protein